jgi:hypothetical protein
MEATGSRETPNAYISENNAPAAQLNCAGAVRLSPPLTEEESPLAMLFFPPLTEANSLLAVFSTPPLTEEENSLAVLLFPPQIEARMLTCSPEVGPGKIFV